MKRHGWAFGLGLLVSGAALAQPPADSERYPPAPDLPGVVVGQSQKGRPVGKVVPIAGSDANQILAEPAQVPKALEQAPEVTLPAPATTIAKPAISVEATPLPAACARPTHGLGLGTGKHLDCVSRFQNWLCFRSRAKQQGCYVTPYRSPLQAWFDCDPKRGTCGPCASVQMPPVGKHHRVVTSPTHVVIDPIPAVIPPTTEKTMPSPSVKPPSVPMPKSGVMAPLPVPPAAPRVEGDLPPGFQRVDVGLGFTPGVSPMAKPTTQTERVSNWRPK